MIGLARALVLAAALVCGLALVAEPRSALSQGRGNDAALPGDGGVLIVGDSIEVAMKPYVQRRLPGIRVTHSAVGGYTSRQILGLLKQSYDPSQSVIVFDAGTNDSPNDPQTLAGNLEAAASRIGSRCMVVPTINDGGVGNAGKNDTVRGFAGSRLGTQTPEWARFVANNPDLMQPDGVHPTPAGADRRAALIAKGVQACLTGSGVLPTARAPSATARRLDAATKRWRSLGLRSRAANARATRAAEEVRVIRGALSAYREAAGATVDAVADTHARTVADYDARTRVMTGAAVGLLALVLIAAGWPLVRRCQPVQWLADAPLWRILLGTAATLVTSAIAMAVLLGGHGAARVAGVALPAAVLGLGAACLMARHSVRVERGMRIPLSGSSRPSRWLRPVLCAATAAACAVTAAGALARDAPRPPVIAPGLRQAAEDSRGDPAEPPTPRLLRARERAAALLGHAHRVDAQRRAARFELARAERAAERTDLPN